ncbi:DEF8 [Cordylochernes scorpioides]|uniref:DEF8 n=1 Tax=Cordylochernes scorpioides TaxID=51811 RepID=A0ABY6JVI8_9ARAC|nr:DEF8 [Cordylochernes scorpioides]
MRRVAAKFVPKLLNYDQKQHRMNIANKMLDSVRDDPNLLQRVMTGDETTCSTGHDNHVEESSGKGELDFTDGYFSNFSNLESYFGFPSSEELQAAIDTCTEMFQECKDDPTRCKQLVRKLIQLKIKREELKDYCIFKFPEENFDYDSENKPSEESNIQELEEATQQQQNNVVPYLRPSARNKYYCELSSDEEELSDDSRLDPTFDPTEHNLFALDEIPIPNSYEEAINSKNPEYWIEAMQREMNSLQEHQMRTFTYFHLKDISLLMKILSEPAPESEENVAGHQMERRQLDLSGPQYCDRCCGLIWTSVLSGWLQCRGCGFQCHPKCVTAITRPCPKLKLPLTHGTAQVKEDPTYILTLCPEKGLSSQGYRCAECRKMVPLQPSWETAIMIRWGLCPENNPSRQCDYTGRYYCHLCHWNSLAIIPARVVHNWDFEPKKVCRASYQFLKLMMRKPCLRLETLNPHLFAFLDDLRTVKQLREEILVAKKYFLSCHVALESGLLLQLSGRMHFVEDGERYSLADLIELEQGSLVPALTAVRDAFLAHITQHCPGCRGKGYICEVCKSEEVIFPFQRKTASCPACSALFHQNNQEHLWSTSHPPGHDNHGPRHSVCLTLNTKLLILQRLQRGETGSALAREHNVHRSTITYIKKNAARILKQAEEKRRYNERRHMLFY